MSESSEAAASCPDCKGVGAYSFPEASSVDMSDGWYDCETCGGTGKAKVAATSCRLDRETQVVIAPCPWCGSDHIASGYVVPPNEKNYWCRWCVKCRAHGPRRDADAESTRAWNTQAVVAELRREREQSSAIIAGLTAKAAEARAEVERLKGFRNETERQLQAAIEARHEAEAQRDAAQAAAGATVALLREWAEPYRHNLPEGHVDSLLGRSLAAIDSDAGKGRHSPEDYVKLEAEAAAMRSVLEHFHHHCLPRAMLTCPGPGKCGIVDALASTAGSELLADLERLREANARLENVVKTYETGQGLLLEGRHNLKQECRRLKAEVAGLREENERLRDVLSSLSSWLGSGLGDERTMAEQYEKGIREGVQTIIRVEVERETRRLTEENERLARVQADYDRARNLSRRLEAAEAVCRAVQHDPMYVHFVAAWRRTYPVLSPAMKSCAQVCL